MYYSKLKRFVLTLSFFVLLLSVYSCKKDEASPTSSNTLPATSTAETKALLESFTWRGIGYRPLPGAAPVDPVANIFLYRFIDTTGDFTVTQTPNPPNYVDYHLTTPTGIVMIKRNSIAYTFYGVYTIDGNRITFDTPNGRFIRSGTYYCLFKDTLAYFNDYPSLTSTDKYHNPVADIPMTTFKKQ